LRNVKGHHNCLVANNILQNMFFNVPQQKFSKGCLLLWITQEQ